MLQLIAVIFNKNPKDVVRLKEPIDTNLGFET